MMNKAKKRELEVTTLRSVYDYCEKMKESHNTDVVYYETCLTEELDKNPDYNSTYYTEQIEESRTYTETYKKIQETIYKMM